MDHSALPPLSPTVAIVTIADCDEIEPYDDRMVANIDPENYNKDTEEARASRLVDDEASELNNGWNARSFGALPTTEPVSSVSPNLFWLHLPYYNMYHCSIWKCLSVTLVKRGKASSLPKCRFWNSISTSDSDSSDSDDNRHSSSENSPIKSCALPDSILKCFVEFGFSHTQVESITSRYPIFLSSINPQKTISSKIRFLCSKGIPEADVVNMVTREPLILTRSLNNHLLPSFDSLKTISGSEQNAITILKHHPTLFRGIPAAFALNLSTLKNLGVPWSKILKMMEGYFFGSVVIKTGPDQFSTLVESLLQMGFDASSSSFGSAVVAMGLENGSYWKRKVKIYQSLGFSENEILHMFRKQPKSMENSVVKIREVVEFFIERFHWSPLRLAKRPNVMLYSLEKRTIPRCSVLQVLWSRNKIGKCPEVSSLLVMTDKAFLETYVTRYVDEVPEVLDAYKGKLRFDEYNFDSGKNEESKAV